MPTEEKPEKTVQEQQQILSILLLKLLYKISEKTTLDIDVDYTDVVTAYFTPPIPEEKLKRKGRRKKTEEHEETDIEDGDFLSFSLEEKKVSKRGRKKIGEEKSEDILPRKTRLYDIWCEQNHYWIRVQNGNRQLIEFGRFPTPDGINRTFFNDQKCNYLQALYNLRNPQKALKGLAHQNTKIKLEGITAWDEKHIAVIKYLQELSYQL